MMKTPPFLLIGCPVIIVVAALVYALTYPSLRKTPFHAALIEAQMPLVDGDKETHAHRIDRELAQLGLSDAQAQQIAQIRQTITDRPQRHEAIMKVLTPDQQTKWQQLREADRNEGTPPPSPATTTNGT
jgi:Spy/CpxP family protein refolding chaperone